MSPAAVPVLAGSTLSVLSLGLLLDNLRRLRVPDPDAVAAPERLAVLLPVRDEVRDVGPCVRALAVALRRWPGQARLMVLDDESRDGTAGVLASLTEELAGAVDLVVLRGSPTPAGWLGKPWACQQLAEAAGVLTGEVDVAVFVDADVRVDPAALTATAALLRTAGLDVACPYPRQVADGAAERLVQPLLQWSWLSTLPLGLAERSPRPSLTAGNGQLLAVDAGAYRRAGGHAAVRSAVLDDLALVRALKAAGGRGGVVDGTHVATCRMYRGGGELREGYAKSLWAAFGGPAGAVAAGSVLVLAHVVPAVATVGGSRVGAVGLVASVAGRVLAARRTGGRAWPDALAHPVSVLALQALTLDSFRRRRRGSLRWKGRPVEAVDARAVR